VQVSFQTISLLATEGDDITFTVDITGDISPSSVTTVYISAFDGSAGIKCI